jgi:hypothetical protein
MLKTMLTARRNGVGILARGTALLLGWNTGFNGSAIGGDASVNPLPVGTNIAQVSRLTPAEAARAYPVRLRASCRNP